MKKIITSIILCVLFFTIIYSQDSRNGYYLASDDTIRFFLVFAEVYNSPDDPGNQPNWSVGQMPSDVDEYFDSEFTDENSINGYLTKYFYQSSFGNLIVLGDYYDSLIRIDWNTMYGNGYLDIISFLNSLPGSDIETAHGYKLNGTDFDKWEPTNNYMPKNQSDNDFIDFFVIVWRNNHKICGSGTFGCGLTDRNLFKPIKNKSGADAFTWIKSHNSAAYTTLRHEYAHQLLGGNNYHSGGAGAGVGNFLSDKGGYSILASYNKSMEGPNAWDRWRLGWKNEGNVYDISGRHPITNEELDCDLKYGQSFPEGTNEFVLRDFISSGDAIRIELPYIEIGNPYARKQYLWLENHQFKNGNIDAKECLTKGLYVNLQIGNDEFGIDDSRTNYISPVNAFGNYDFSYETYLTDYKIIASNQLANPLSGYHLLMLPAYNYIEPNIYGSTAYIDNIFSSEFIPVEAVEFNGVLMQESNFCYETYPVFGTIYDAFQEGETMGVGTNPSTASRLTHYTSYRYSRPGYPGKPEPDNNQAGSLDDSRTVYLNGISVKFIDQHTNGDIKVKIKWDDFNLLHDSRWCGDIVLKENLIISYGRTLDLDQGLTPTRPVNPITINSEKIFASPIILNCMENSYLEIENLATINVKNNSTLNLKEGSELKITEGGEINVEDGGIFNTEPGSIITIEDNTIIQSSTGTINLCNASINGTGTLNNVPLNLSFSNLTLAGINTYQAWNTIECQNVTISDNSNITISAKDHTIINGPFQMGTNAELHIIPNCPE